MGEVEHPRLYRTLRSFFVPQMRMPIVSLWCSRLSVRRLCAAGRYAEVFVRAGVLTAVAGGVLGITPRCGGGSASEVGQPGEHVLVLVPQGHGMGWGEVGEGALECSSLHLAVDAGVDPGGLQVGVAEDVSDVDEVDPGLKAFAWPCCA